MKAQRVTGVLAADTVTARANLGLSALAAGALGATALISIPKPERAADAVTSAVPLTR